MDRLVRVFGSFIIVLIALFVGTKLALVRRHTVSPTVMVRAPVPTSLPASPPDQGSCSEAVVLTVQAHSGVTARFSIQDLNGVDQATTDASPDEGQFTTTCYRADNDEPSGDSSPQVLRVCKPSVFVVHITGSGKGVFDFQAKALPEVSRPIGPLLLCNYALDGEKDYDWVLKYQGGLKPAVFLLGSKGDPNVRP